MELRILQSVEELDFTKLNDAKTGEPLIMAWAVEEVGMCSDGIGAILIPATANKAAVKKTLATGLATFWSRSRSGLWTKGATSGNTLSVAEIYVDCDADTVVYVVRTNGRPVTPALSRALALLKPRERIKIGVTLWH